LFGLPQQNVAHLRDRERAAGYLECGRAKVRWFLSVDRRDLPQSAANGRSTFRSITIDGAEVEFSEGFADLHTRSYQEIVAGRGFGLDLVRPAVEIVSAFGTLPLERRAGERHPFVERYAAA
jgi:UDP-N-acetyl-2-amino-2-deoxyglucuronate dehydrogenase